MEKYTIIKDKDEKEAIFDNEKKIIISEWYDKIYTDTLDKYYFNNTDSINPRKQYHIKSNGFYIVRKKDEEAIFSIDNKNNDKGFIISQWWNQVFSNGLIMNESEYYIVQNKNIRYSIFHKDCKNKPISNSYTEIGSIGLVDGTSRYFLIRNTINKVAICSINDNQKEVQLSDFWDKIEAEDLLFNKSEYYTVNRFNPYSCETQKNIFHINDRFYPISKWSYVVNE